MMKHVLVVLFPQPISRKRHSQGVQDNYVGAAFESWGTKLVNILNRSEKGEFCLARLPCGKSNFISKARAMMIRQPSVLRLRLMLCNLTCKLWWWLSETTSRHRSSYSGVKCFSLLFLTLSSVILEYTAPTGYKKDDFLRSITPYSASP